MYRRLFFLLPDKSKALHAVQDLLAAGIQEQQIHAMAKPDVNLEGLPTASPNQRKDMHTKIETSLWHLNLGIFFVALFVLVSAFLSSSYYLLFASLVVMVATYALGFFYLKQPTIHLSGFHAAFQHGEILLMVDIPKHRVTEVEQILHQKNPAATEEGISWTPSDLSLNM